MSRDYRMDLTIRDYDPNRLVAIKAALQKVFSRDLLIIGVNEIADGVPRCLVAIAMNTLYAGETCEIFAERMRDAVYNGNGVPCTVELNVYHLDDPPVRTFHWNASGSLAVQNHGPFDDTRLALMWLVGQWIQREKPDRKCDMNQRARIMERLAAYLRQLVKTRQYLVILSLSGFRPERFGDIDLVVKRLFSSSLELVKPKEDAFAAPFLRRESIGERSHAHLLGDVTLYTGDSLTEFAERVRNAVCTANGGACEAELDVQYWGNPPCRTYMFDRSGSLMVQDGSPCDEQRKALMWIVGGVAHVHHS